MTYSETKACLDEIAGKNAAAANSLRVVKNGATNVKAVLDAMPAKYASALAEIAADAAGNPDDQAWQTAAAEALLLTADFLAHQTTAGAMVTALEPFEV